MLVFTSYSKEPIKQVCTLFFLMVGFSIVQWWPGDSFPPGSRNPY